MKKSVVKKYAKELYKSMILWATSTDEDGINLDTMVKPGKVVKGKRMRQLTRPEVIKYFAEHEGIDFDIPGLKFNANRKYIISADNYVCNSDDYVGMFVYRA